MHAHSVTGLNAERKVINREMGMPGTPIRQKGGPFVPQDDAGSWHLAYQRSVDLRCSKLRCLRQLS
jgi:hypothetical protein